MKKYRGILLAKISNNVLMHDNLTVDPHNPGDHRDTCEACEEYLEDKKQFDMVGKLLDLDDDAANGTSDQVQKHYFYVVTDLNSNSYVVRAYNKEHAVELLGFSWDDDLAKRPEQVSRKEAMALVAKYDGKEKEKTTTQYLRDHDYYVGTVASSLKATVLAD